MRLIQRWMFLAALCAPVLGLAQSGAPVRILMSFAPGASGDLMARAVGEKIRAATGESFVVESKPGAGGRIAMEAAKAGSPDGKTLIITSSTPLTVFPWLYKKLNYDPFNDFEPVAHVVGFKYAFVVNAEVPASNLAEFIALVKSNPKYSFFSSPSQNGGPHIAGEAFARAAQIKLTYVGYKATSFAITDMLGGQLPAMMGNLADYVELSKRGKMKILGVASAERSLHVPQVATFREQGFDIEAGGWFAIYAPAKTPGPIKARLAKAITEGIVQPDVKALADKYGLEVTGYGPAQLAAIQKKEYEITGSRIRAFGFKVED
jgi:tripartite-type tricarboxylate transporter receptor subunit TctC